MSANVKPIVVGKVRETDSTDLKLLSLNEFVQRPTVSSLVRGVIPAQAIVVVFGPPKGGKTFSMCDLAMHAAHGLDWHGCAVSRRMKVVYLAGEGVNGLRVRLRAWLEHHDSIEDAGEFRILPTALSLPDRINSLVDVLRPIAPDILVLDTLNAFFGGGDENSTQDMTTWCGAIRYLRDHLGCSIVVVHHTGHGDASRERGSIVLRATADVPVQVAKDEGAGELIGFQVIAARDFEPMESAISLKLTRHETGWIDDDGQALVSCVVLAGNEPVTLPGRGGRPLGHAQAAVLGITQELARATTPDSAGFAQIPRHQVADLAKKRGFSRQSVSSAWHPLANRKLVRLIEPGFVAIRVQP